jgi:hypothetical protein
VIFGIIREPGGAIIDPGTFYSWELRITMPDRRLLTLALIAILSSAARGDDERAKKVAVQKKRAAEIWTAVDAGESASSETKHLLVHVPKSMESRLKAIGALLEKYHDQAIDALDIKPEEAYPGKITVFLFPQRDILTTFVRRVEGRRPAKEDAGSFSAADDRLRAAAAVSTTKGAAPVEAFAGEQLASLLLIRRAGVSTNVPDWLVQGFGRASSYRVLPRDKFVLTDRKLTRVLVRKRSASDVWGGTLEPEEVDCLQGSLTEMLAYGPGAKRFGKLLDGFKPGENVDTKTVAQAMEAAGISPDKVNTLWKSYVR